MSIIAQREFFRTYDSPAGPVTVHFVLRLEQRRFYKWLRLTGTLNGPNAESSTYPGHLADWLHAVEQRSIIKEADGLIKRFYLPKYSGESQWIKLEKDVGE